MILKRNKRGLSPIVATLIIILLVFISTGLAWVVVKNVILNNKEEMNLGKLTLNLEIENVQAVCDNSNNYLILAVRRNSGKGEFTGLNFIVEDGENSEVFTENVTMGELEVKTFAFELSEIKPENIERIKIIPIFMLSSGKETLGNINGEYSPGSDLGVSCTPNPSELPLINYKNCSLAPVAIDATNINSSSFVANWNSVRVARGYYLDVAKDTDFTNFIVDNLDVGNVTSYQVTGLDSGTMYYYRVRTHESICMNNNSNIIIVQCNTIYPPCGNETFCGGNGTLGDPFRITNCTQLQKMNNNLTAHYILISDIDCSDTINWNYLGNVTKGTSSGRGFLAIGDASATSFFRGTFDGQNHKITNLFINKPYTSFLARDAYNGLFGWNDFSGIIKNVGLENVNISGWIYAGGLVGSNYGTIINSYSTGVVFITRDYTVGGLVGTNFGNITNSYSNADAITNVSGGTGGGGLVGYNAGNITNSYATGNVVGTYARGGLVGSQNGGRINNSYSTGNVSGSGMTIGGLVGRNISGTTTNSFWDINTSGRAISQGGTGKATAEMKTQSTFVGWDFASVWNINEGISYPYLI